MVFLKQEALELATKLLRAIRQYVVQEARDLAGVEQSIDDLRALSQSLEAHASKAANNGDDDQTTKYLVMRSRLLAAEAKQIVDDYDSRFGTNTISRCSNSILNPSDLSCINKDIIKIKATAKEFLKNMAEVLQARRNSGSAAAGPPPQSIHVECSVNLDSFLEELKAFCSSLQHTVTGASGTGETPANAGPIIEEHRMASLFKNVEDIVGFEEHKQELLGRLRADELRRVVVSVVGMAGRGKTTLVRQVYNSIGDEEFPCRAWLDLSPNYIGGREGLRELFLGIGGAIEPGSSEELRRMEETKLRDHVKGMLREKRYLMVLDNVWEANLWEMMQAYLPDAGNGSRVIVTTRCENAAPRGGGSSVFKLGALGDCDSWELFRLQTFPDGDDETADRSLAELAARLARGCGGLPLELINLGRLLGKQQRSTVAWELAVERFRRGEEEEGRVCPKTARLSYTHMPQYLEPFFLYLGSFPLDHPVDVERLIQLYVAEGLAGAAMEEEARVNLRELELLCLVEIAERPIPHQVSYGIHRYPVEERREFCHIHGLLHHIATKEAKRKGFVQIKEREIDQSTQNTRVALHGSDKYSVKESGNKSLLTLLDFRRASSVVNLRGFPSLKVLELEGVQVATLPSAIGELAHLLHLGLRDSKVERLPESVARLSKLITVDTRNSRITDLPRGVWKIATLRHIRCRCRPDFDGAAAGPRDLRTLDGARMGLWVDDVLPSLPCLHTLSLFGTPEFHVLGSTALPATLVELRLFDTVVSATLWSRLQMSLPSLEILHLVCCFVSDGEIASVADGFARLQVLVLMDLESLRSWKVEGNSMKSLKSLSLIRCTQLLMEAEDLRNVCAEELTFVGMSQRFLESVETAKSLGMSFGPGTLIAPSEDRPKDAIYKAVTTLTEDVLPLLNDGVTKGTIEELEKKMDELKTVVKDLREAEHALRWSSEGDDDQWAQIWAGQIGSLDELVQNRFLELCQLCRFWLCKGLERTTLDHINGRDAVDDLRKMRRKMGLL